MQRNSQDGALEILASSTLNSIQDQGRRHSLTLGVSVGGAMDRFALSAGNALIGNDLSLAGIEVVFFPFRLKFHADTVFALTGADTGANLDGSPIPAWWAVPARAGQVLSLGAPRVGARAYIAVTGGIDVPVVLGSRATDQKGGFGGIGGRGLQRGDRLPLGAPTLGSITGNPKAFPQAGLGAAIQWPEVRADAHTTVRVLPAAEWDRFAPEVQEQFLSVPWQVSADANRVGYRLSGPELVALCQDSLMSHGIVPGTIQVPSSGQPIVQLADANTCGGYPKIATVIEADQRLLAQTRVGGQVRFVLATRAQAQAALRAQHDDLLALSRALGTVTA
ncbi:biotin-dependent carboxyltransferase family protein [Acetobacter sp. TBRC 12305]|uniref:Biotin-dependent carboxyltransferase family protein n=1 Tax=Acetobacter garciniae TaxID=2817435 RepID=A0A939HQQ8_9PROT|nr:biotin-dependent carboxyltransferase family protein [Acetobacter garciniae]MBO1325771.1 biotin-dependent carboxyltransferase family protein [Acetobacter garciniae]MBX0345671.1 biotin-dependent carboxyltransferase family protein [Acetobacter garciniae]